MQTSDTFSLLLTTSRNPSSRGRHLLKELLYVLPNSVKINRGHLNIEQIFANAKQKNCSRVLIVSSHHGNPNIISGYQYIVHKTGQEYLWVFDWYIRSLKLVSELQNKAIKKSFATLHWNFSDVQPEVETLLSSFFHIPKNTTRKSDEEADLNLEFTHLESGYLFQCLLRDGTLIAPEFVIEEIRVAEDNVKD